MAAPTTSTPTDWHRFFAVDCNQLVWKLLAKEDRSAEDDLTMLHAAHASYYHWLQVGKVETAIRGEWMCSRVYAVLAEAAPALKHAQHALRLCEENDVKDFDLAYAYEAMARAYAVADQRFAARQFHVLASDAARDIKSEDDRKIFLQDFLAEPWFGVF